MKYNPRIADAQLNDMLDAIGAVLIEGPKWCGKTTTAKQQSKSSVSLDDSEGGDSIVQLAKVSPARILQGDVPRLIDEWQVVPAIWDAVRFAVDKRGEAGQFILTGSATPLETDRPHHSGTGRLGRLRMDPMSLFESGDSSGSVSIRALLDRRDEIDGESLMDIEELAFLCSRGGWPSVCNRKISISGALLIAKEYVKSIIHSEISTPDGVVVNSHMFSQFLHSYARHIGTQSAVMELVRDCVNNQTKAFSENTAYSYMKKLKDLFVVDEAEAWNPNLRSKAATRTSPTRYFCDPSIAVAGLGAGPDDLISDMQTFGFVFENLCIRDLRVYARAVDGDVLHYRDSNGLECDAVLHFQNGKFALIEIKIGGAEAIEHGAKTLNKLESVLNTKPVFKMVLTGVTRFPYRRDDGVFIVPIGCLGP